MGDLVLFSPVGGTDPISQANYKDGSLLHICRVYKPDKVVLYMSSEVIRYQEADDRYRYCIKSLYEKLGKDILIEEILRPDLVDVQDFNYFYEEFRGILFDLFESLNQNDTLLINVSSGTPAMKSSLLVLVTLGELPCRAIQVVTPVRAMNEHDHHGYDVELLWSMDEDNADDFENRCSEIRCPSLVRLNKEDMIKKFVLSYDYQSAIRVADTMPQEYVSDYCDLLRMASLRLSLDYKGAFKIGNEYNIKCFPIREESRVRHFEYALSLDIKRKKREFADFVRAITPIVLVVFERILLKQGGVNIDDYCMKRGSVREWNAEKLRGTDIEAALIKKWYNFKYGPVYSVHILEIIAAFMPDELELNSILTSLRSVESKVRNMAAHEVTLITDKMIKDETGMDSEEIMKTIRKAFVYTDMNVKKSDWDAYDNMNEVIINAIK